MITDATPRPRPAVMAFGRRFNLERPRRPIGRMEVARLVACESPTDVAQWCMGRLMAQACFRGDPDAGETIETLRLFLARGGDS